MAARLVAALALLGLLGRAPGDPPGSPREDEPLPEGNAYIRSVILGPHSQDAAIDDYSYDLEDVRENLDKNGAATSREVRTYQVYFVHTRPVRRLVARNGVALKPREQADVDRKAEAKAKAISEGRTVSERPGIRISGMADSFVFTTVGREMRQGRKTLILRFVPLKNPAPKPSSDSAGDALRGVLTGRVLIDEADRRLVLLEARNVAGEKASVATGVKVGDFQLTMEYEKADDKVWLPRRVQTVLAGRAFFFKTFRVRQTTTYSNFKRFSVETQERIIPR